MVQYLNHSEQLDKPIRIGVNGTGFISIGLCQMLRKNKSYAVSKILTRRHISSFDTTESQALVTNNVQELIDNSDVIVECTGDAIWATIIIDNAFQANLPVITMNAEFQVVAGSYYQEYGILCESEGDQPGSLAALDYEVGAMGFTPVVYGSQKGFINQTPDMESMQNWAHRQGQRLNRIVSFTDGTKVQIESALIANGLGASISRQGLLGPSNQSTKSGALELADYALQNRKVISDYVLNDQGKGEIFIVAKHHGLQNSQLSYYKMGDGPFYYFEKPYHMGHFEIIKSIEKALRSDTFLFNNGPHASTSVAAIAKKTIKPGTLIEHGIGSFEVRGEAVNICDEPAHVPIGLLENCEIQRVIEPGEMLKFSDIALKETLASKAWFATRDTTLTADSNTIFQEKNQP